MKIKVGITQRVINNTSYPERRDALDQRWSILLSQANILSLPIPNNPVIIEEFISDNQLQGIILSGGNDLVSYGGDAPERDETEKNIIKFCIQNQIPILGVCRGMQLINEYFGGTLHSINNHVCQSMTIKHNNINIDVNSYHTWGLDILGNDLEITGIHETDQVIKAIIHKQYPIQGIMWHPERIEPNFSTYDIQLIKKHFNNQ